MEVTKVYIDKYILNLSKFAKFNGRALKDAMNRGHSAGKTKAVKFMHNEWKGMKSSDIKRYTWSAKATVNKSRTEFAMTGRSINLIDFGATWSRGTATGKSTKGVSYKLKSKRRTLKGSFIAKGMVFTKKKGGRGIIPHFSITPTSMFIGSTSDDQYIETYFNTFNKRYFTQLDRLLGS